MTDTGRWPSIDAEPERYTRPAVLTRLWRALRPTEWATVAVVLVGAWGLFWWASGDPIVAVFVSAAVALVVVPTVVGCWTVARLRSQDARILAVERRQDADRADLLDLSTTVRNDRLTAARMPAPRTPDSTTKEKT